MTDPIDRKQLRARINERFSKSLEMLSDDPIGTAQERELIERLKSRTYAGTRPSHRGDRSVWTLNNPDGAEAADALESRIAEVGRLEEALRFIAFLREANPNAEAEDCAREMETEARAALSLQRRV